MKKLLPILVLSAVLICVFLIVPYEELSDSSTAKPVTPIKTKKKTNEERMLYAEERELHEFNMQRNPVTGDIPLEEKALEFENAVAAIPDEDQRITASTYEFRGPSNLGGRTRALVVDMSDTSSNTILAGGISGGVFRTTNGGASWTKVSANDEIHNVSSLAQDSRPGFQNIWYYGTGEWSGNSASLGSAFRGQGIWQSTDGGITWAQIAATNSPLDVFDSAFDYINELAVNPVTGDLIVAATGKIYRYDGTTFTIELEEPSNGTGWTDIAVTSNGRVYASIEGSNATANGVYTSPTGEGSWTRISQNGDPVGWSSAGRTLVAAAPSNNDIVYVLYVDGTGGIEADLWRYSLSGDSWTDFSTKLPDEPGGDLAGNDPFAVQGGYSIALGVKPDDDNFVIVGGTNIYKIEDINTDATFTRIGGYINNQSYGLYNVGGVVHHPDIHALEFDPNNNDVFFSGTDGGVHRTNDINANTIPWVNLNNDYRTYQFYHVAMDPQTGSDIVFGGTQDNGTVRGGLDVGQPDSSTMQSFFGGDGVAVGVARRPSELQYYFGTQNGSAFRFGDNSGFINIRPNGSNSQFVTYFYLDPDNNDALYYAGLNRLYMTTNSQTVNTVNWTNLGTLPVNQNIRTLATSPGIYDPTSSYILIGGQNGRVFRLDDPQNQTNLIGSVDITPTGASTAGGSIVSGLAIHPTNPDIVLATYANYGITNIYLTSNATSANPSWTLVERNLPTHSVRSAAIAEVGAEDIYFVGTARGLYSSPDPLNEDWSLEGQNEIGFAVVSGLVYRATDRKLLVGTHGNGMFDTTVENTLSLNSFNADNNFTVYPNPATRDLNIDSKTFNLNGKISYEIIDLNGKFVNKGVLQDKKIDVSNLNSGIYFINLDIEKSKQTLKFIKK